MLIDTAKYTLEKIFDRRRVRVLVHRAVFVDSLRECYFVNVTNLSRDRDVEVTHIWFECDPKVYVNEAGRVLPKRLEPDESWETWIDVKAVTPPDGRDSYTLARARLSSGSIIQSRENKNVPDYGSVPGGPIEKGR